jgi:hypothetical protein
MRVSNAFRRGVPPRLKVRRLARRAPCISPRLCCDGSHVKGNIMGKHGPARKPLVERFWSKVNRRGPDDCWLWTGKTNKGFGRIATGGASSSLRGVHRLSWEIANGPLLTGPGSDGIWVLHRCDNQACVNPAHLYLGPRHSTAADKKRLGRPNVSKS